MRYFYENKLLGIKDSNGKWNSLTAWQDANGIKYPANWIQLATQEELNAVGVITLEDLPAPTPTPLTLAELKAQKISEINFAFEQAMHQVKTGYPQDEILTWSKQESEARAWLSDNNAETPLLDAYVVVKSVTKANLVNAIIYKADMFATICGSLVGKRQYLEDVINSATLEGIANISW